MNLKIDVDAERPEAHAILLPAGAHYLERALKGEGELSPDMYGDPSRVEFHPTQHEVAQFPVVLAGVDTVTVIFDTVTAQREGEPPNSNYTVLLSCDETPRMPFVHKRFRVTLHANADDTNGFQTVSVPALDIIVEYAGNRLQGYELAGALDRVPLGGSHVVLREYGTVFFELI